METRFIVQAEIWAGAGMTPVVAIRLPEQIVEGGEGVEKAAGYGVELRGNGATFQTPGGAIAGATLLAERWAKLMEEVGDGEGAENICFCVPNANGGALLPREELTRWAEVETARMTEHVRAVANGGRAFRLAETKGPAWTLFIQAMRSGLPVEIDEAMYMRWLEIIPPVFQRRIPVTIEGVTRTASFGFAEGSEPVIVFWWELTPEVEGGQRYWCQRGPWETPEEFRAAHAEHLQPKPELAAA